jgi:hypothetical protein
MIDRQQASPAFVVAHAVEDFAQKKVKRLVLTWEEDGSVSTRFIPTRSVERVTTPSGRLLVRERWFR